MGVRNFPACVGIVVLWVGFFGLGLRTPSAEADPSRRPTPKAGSARLEGTVYDTESRPIAGIRLILRLRAEPDVSLETVTDAQGRYRLDRLAGGYYDVALRWGDRTVVQVTVWLAHGRPHRVDFYIDGRRLTAGR